MKRFLRPYIRRVIVAIFKESLARDHRGFRESTVELINENLEESE